MMNDRLSSIMTTNVVTVHPDDNLHAVWDILFNRGFHHLPVVENKQMRGIITSYDLMKLNKRGDDLKSIAVKEVMTTKVATLGPTELIGAAAMIFLKHLFHGLPIVNDDNELVGIVTTHDILKYEFLKEYPDDTFLKDTRWVEEVAY